MGEVGTGQLTKMVNQICIAGLVEALSEGLSFARASGLDAQRSSTYQQGRGAVMANGKSIRDNAC